MKIAVEPHMPTKTNTAERDELVADPTVARELDRSLMTLWRLDNDPEMVALGWPAKIQINRRNFRSRHQLEEFKKKLLRRAMAERKRLAAADVA